MGTGNWSFAAGVKEDCLEIIGSEGKIRLSIFGTETPELSCGETVECLADETPKHVQQPLIQTIVEELNGTGACPSTGDSAARTNWVLEQLVR